MKKIISLLLCISLLVSGTVFAAGAETEKKTAWNSETAGEILKKLQIMIGTADGQLKLDRSVTRAEALALIGRMTEPCFSQTGETESPFKDMENHWAKDTVSKFYRNGFVKGTSADAFTPDRSVTGREFITILLRAMGYADTEPALVNGAADLAGLNEIPKVILETKDLKRGGAAQICVAAFNGICKNGKPLSRMLMEAGLLTEETLENLLTETNGSYGDAAAFADALFERLAGNENFMASPFSVKTALAMAANGAAGETREQILKAAEIDDLDAFNRFSQETIAKYEKTDLMKLETANSIWINESRTVQNFRQDYRDKIENFYDGQSGKVNNENAVKTVNDWVGEKTRGKISSIVDDNEFWAVLVNAVYFKAAWENTFSESATKEGQFTNGDGKKTTADFMHQTDWMNYCKAGDTQILELPYQYRMSHFDENGEYLGTEVYEDLDVSMYILLSGKEIGEPAQLTEKCLQEKAFERKYISLSLPKFKIEYSVSLKDTLKKIGIQNAFDEKTADFKQMFDQGNMWIDGVVHKTFINVDEKGTEAAAVTAIGMAGSALPPEPMVFNADKPFTFLIRDNTNGEILFMGTYAFAE